VSLLAALAYAAYVALFIILPGVVHYGLASRSARVPLVFAAKATVVGQCVEMVASLLASLLASMTGAHALYPFLPLLYLAGLVKSDRSAAAIGAMRTTVRPSAPT
jgi:hypothetical protein